MRSGALRATAGLTAGLVLITLAWVTASAHGATYTVWSCRGPDGGPISAQAWQSGDDSRATEDTCAKEGALGARLLPSDNAPGVVRGFRFLPPPGAAIAGYRVHLYARTAETDLKRSELQLRPEWPAELQAGLDLDPGLSVTEIDEGCVAPGCEFGVPDSPLDPKNLITGSETKGHGLVVGARCGGLFGCHAQEGEAALAEVRMFSSEIELRDDEAPVIGPAAGTLPAAQGTISATAAIGAEVGDTGGGVASVELLIDGERTDVWSAGCNKPYTVPAPCPARVAASFAVDAAALTDGPHAAQLRALDAAGNVTTGDDVPFTVQAPPPPPPPPPTPEPTVVERPVAVPFAVPVPFEVPVEPRRVVIRVPDRRVDLVGGRARVAGTVRLPGGGAVAGARVIVRSRPLGVRRHRWRVERTLTTDEGGRFDMAARDVSRLLELDVDDSTHRAVAPAEVELLHRLRVRVVQRSRGLRNGSLMRLHTEVDGAGRGTAGKVALVQAVVGGRWSTVESLTLNPAGRATWRYRFRNTTRPAVYRFRVRVEHSGDVWPWPTTHSRVLRVLVRP